MQPTSTKLSSLAFLDLLATLGPYPEVQTRLTKIGARLSPKSGEDRASLENHIASQLMALFRDSRDAETFEALHAFTQAAVYDWVVGLLRGSNGSLDAREILQDTFINVYRYAGSFRSDHDGSFRVWVRTIAGNLVRRAYSRRPTRRFEDMPEGYREPADPKLGPEGLAQVDEEQERLRTAWVLLMAHYKDAFGKLSSRDQYAMHLVEVEGISYREAGEKLGVRQSNMKMILFRARKRLVNHMRRSMGVLPGLGSCRKAS
jgi:RNA polymerase sigma factor (sigma-70 family)